MQEDPDAWWWSQKADYGDCGCNSHSWAKACRQWAAATAAGVDRLLCHLRAAAGEGREETGLQQRTPPIHHHLPRNPPSPPHFLWLRKEWGTERETYHQVLDKLRVKLGLQMCIVRAPTPATVGLSLGISRSGTRGSRGG